MLKHGVQIGRGGGSRSGGGVQIGGGGPDRVGGVQVKELLSNTFFVLAVCGGKIFSNFLFFSRIFSKGGGVRDRGGLS